MRLLITSAALLVLSQQAAAKTYYVSECFARLQVEINAETDPHGLVSEEVMEALDALAENLNYSPLNFEYTTDNSFSQIFGTKRITDTTGEAQLKWLSEEFGAVLGSGVTAYLRPLPSVLEAQIESLGCTEFKELIAE